MALNLHDLKVADRRVKKLNQNQDNSIKLITGTDFKRAVLDSDRPVAVVFSASWSRPCEVLGATLLDVIVECGSAMTWIQLDADANPDLSLFYGVDSIPTILIFSRGACQARIVGTATKQAILARLARVLPGPTV